MTLTGGCYCGEVRYRIDAEPLTKGMCFCRECQHIAGGGANVIMGVPATGFAYTVGEPKRFARSDLESPATREFCGNCGTHLTTLSPRLPGAVLVKVGGLDDPSAFGMPQVAIYAAEKQVYHIVPEGVTSFDGRPQR